MKDSQVLATAGQDWTVRLWDPRTGDTRSFLHGHDDEVNCVSWSPDGRALATSSKDATVRLWGLERDRARISLSVPTAPTPSFRSYYQIHTVTTKKVKKRKETILQPITTFTVSYLSASDAVEIILGADETFATGGQITVLGGPTTASGGTLSGNAVFTISVGGRHVSAK